MMLVVVEGRFWYHCGAMFAPIFFQIRFEIVQCFKRGSAGTKKTLFFLYENDNRTFAHIKHLLSSTIDRPTSLLHTILHHLYTYREAENACKTNEKQRKTKNSKNERYDPRIKHRKRHRDAFHQWSNEEMHIRFKAGGKRNLIFRRCASRSSQNHFFTPANAPKLLPTTPQPCPCACFIWQIGRLIYSSSHSVDYYGSKIINFTQGFPLFS